MSHVIFRVARSTVAFAAAAISACTGDLPTTGPRQAPEPLLAAGDIYTVTNTNDNGIGSLRWALGFMTGGEIIRFDPILAGQTITVDSSLTIEYPGTIEGPVNKGITISGGGLVQILKLRQTGTITFRNLTFRGGNAPAGGSGGVVASSAPLTLENSTVYDNEASGYGAILSGTLTLVNTTVSGNRSTNPPGFPRYPAVAAQKLVMINSTVAHNSDGGIAGGGGVNNPMLVMRNSVVSNNGAGPNCSSFATSTFEGTNVSNDDSCGGPTGAVIADPLLAPLTSNGGPGSTHALMVGSPAINTGTSCNVAFDQRYVARDAQCDLGAFEFIDFTTVVLTVGPSPTVNRNTGWAVVTGTVQCSRNEAFDVMVRLAQNEKPGLVQAVGTSPVTCGTTPRPWSVALAPSPGKFTIGGAQVMAQTLNAKAWVTSASTTGTVKLFWSHK